MVLRWVATKQNEKLPQTHYTFSTTAFHVTVSRAQPPHFTAISRVSYMAVTSFSVGYNCAKVKPGFLKSVSTPDSHDFRPRALWRQFGVRRPRSTEPEVRQTGAKRTPPGGVDVYSEPKAPQFTPCHALPRRPAFHA